MNDIFKFNIYDIKNFKQLKGRLLGIDFGVKRIGVAVSDVGQEIATPLSVLDNNKILIEELKKIILDYKIIGFVIGLPKKLNGDLGEISDKIYQFGVELKELLNLPICFWDERFSSKLAENILLEFDISRKKRKIVIDKLAAAHILQNALDYLRFN